MRDITVLKLIRQFVSVVLPIHLAQQVLERLGRVTKEVRPAETLELASGGKMRLKREEASVAVSAQTPQQIRPARLALACRHDAAIKMRILHVNIAQPGTQCLVGVRIGRLLALDKVGGIEYGLEMGVVDALQPAA